MNNIKLKQVYDIPTKTGEYLLTENEKAGLLIIPNVDTGLGNQRFWFGNLKDGGWRAPNCGMPDNNNHACWSFKTDHYGDNLSISSECGAGEGSIGAKTYHAFIDNGWFIVGV